MSVEYTDIGGLKVVATECNIFALCDRLRGKSVLVANRGDMRMAAEIIESLMSMLGEAKIEDDILSQIPF